MQTKTKTTTKRSATIINVAQMADVSIGTVSRYLNGYQVKAGNQQRIEEAIEKLSYSRNAFASAMKSEASNMVGLLVPDYDEFHALLLGSLVTALRRDGLVTITYCHESNSEGLRDAVEFFRTHRVGTLIMSGMEAEDKGVQAMLNDGVQFITYDNDPHDEAIDQVKVNNRDAARIAVSRLLELGHERIAVLTGAMENWTAGERLDGYKDAFAKYGKSIPEELILHGDWRREYGRQAMERLWHLKDRPTALFASNHQMMLGVLAYTQEHGIRIPDDLSLLSFDDIEMFQYLTPSITAISQPVTKIAEAVRRLLINRRAASVGGGGQVEVLTCDFIERESIAPPRQNKAHLSMGEE